jgi:integrase
VEALGFAAFAEARNERDVRTETVLTWAAEAPSTTGRRGRWRVGRRFAQPMQAEDERYEVPPATACGRATRQPRLPHIYPPDDIRRLLHAAAHRPPIGSMRPTTSGTLVALIASAGLRISEALALQLDHLPPAGLRIEQTKCRKSRLVPLHPTAQQGLHRYWGRRRQVGGTCRSLFVSR